MPKQRTFFDVRDQLRTICSLVGIGATARLLGVSRSQPSRWESGRKSPSPDHRRRISELSYMLDRLTQVLKHDFIVEWLATPQPRLSGSTPATVFRLKGARPVIEVIESIHEGTYL